jgi:hypothetical protein
MYDDGTPISHLRVDAPAEIRKRAQRVSSGMFDLVIAVAVAAVLADVAAAVLLLVGGFRSTDFIGAAGCAGWAVAWVLVARWAVRRKASVRPWYITPRVREVDVWRAHGVYEKLTPETQASYGRALVARIYDLSLTDVRGAGERVIRRQIDDRLRALRGLVDAEDKMRLYAAEPALADRDDVNTAKLWQQAVDEANKYLRSNDL